MITLSRPGARLESLARRTAPRASKTSTIEGWTTGGPCRLSVRVLLHITSCYVPRCGDFTSHPNSGRDAERAPTSAATSGKLRQSINHSSLLVCA
jgi:hypothetical protein